MDGRWGGDAGIELVADGLFELMKEVPEEHNSNPTCRSPNTM